MNDKTKEIRKIEDKYGMIMFRMRLIHIMEVGTRNFDDASVVESISQITAETKADKNSNQIPVITPEFQCELIRCAAELAKFSPLTLLGYVKKHVFIAD